MNFLAHQYLSGSDDYIKIGNFVADMIRGKEMEQFDEGIQQGIQLHRAIDHFTDNHDQVKKAIQLFRSSQGKYAPVIVDITFDHFLAANWSSYSEQELNSFANNFYDLMIENLDLMPEKVQWIIPRMKAQNWLYEYQYLDGIQQAYEGISRRANFRSNMAFARVDLENHYDELQQCFSLFFDDIISFVRSQNKHL
ncbi:acyl carrier protein phosphodiesterase [Parvicella tangerina]|uniref:Acyl carrier protein phosphodiesterase n=1 Tax=Parvicella tangerina TaxID=2829795 RepID=A0A916JLZ1_9FLAO|nr:ACP phosphodiesterase [Parvicella tangerina]CAG5081117.1 Acyl carrier protein phosphodiesterase [Parvicella tangerina]